MDDRRGLLLLLLSETGLSQAELARFKGVAPRTVSRWLDGSYPVPDDVVADLSELAARQRAIAAATGTQAAERPVLLVYRHDGDLPPGADFPTATAHLAAVAHQWRSCGGNAAVVLFDRNPYDLWRRDRTDTEDARAAWALAVAQAR